MTEFKVRKKSERFATITFNFQFNKNSLVCMNYGLTRLKNIIRKFNFNLF